MRHKPEDSARFFYATAPMPCPYLPGRVERRLVTELAGRNVAQFHDTLSQAGFRRSHGIAYVPVCEDCSACATVRIVVPGFRRTRSHRRVWAANADLTATIVPSESTAEQFRLFSAYQHSRHGGGDMARMDFYDYQALIEDTPVETEMIEFRDPGGTLVAACLADRLSDGLSAVYSFFEPGHASRSLGTHMILWMVDQAAREGLAHVYLGFWVADCRKMSYKVRFQLLEAYTPQGWRPLDPDDPETTRPFRAGP